MSMVALKEDRLIHGRDKGWEEIPLMDRLKEEAELAHKMEDTIYLLINSADCWQFTLRLKVLLRTTINPHSMTCM